MRAVRKETFFPDPDRGGRRRSLGKKEEVRGQKGGEDGIASSSRVGPPKRQTFLSSFPLAILFSYPFPPPRSREEKL